MNRTVLLILSLVLLSANTRGAQRNMIPNGDFDSPAGDCPAGWERQVGSSDELMYVSDNPHNGTHFLKLDTMRAEAGKKIQWHLKGPIPLLPGEKYRVEYFFRIDQSSMTRVEFTQTEKPIPEWPQKTQKSTKTAARMLECKHFESLWIFVFFVAIYPI